MSHPIDRYFAKHGHYPRVVVSSGIQRLTVEFARGYIRISTSSPHAGEVYITAQAARELYRKRAKILGLLRHQDCSVDIPKKLHRYFLEEMAHLQALRQQKALRKQVDPEKRERQKKRYLAARRRAASR